MGLGDLRGAFLVEIGGLDLVLKFAQFGALGADLLPSCPGRWSHGTRRIESNLVVAAV